MASVSHDKRTGRRTIQFVGADGKRRSVRLGKVSKRQAESAKRYVEDLIACRATGTVPKGTTAEWIAALPSSLRGRLERVELIEPRSRRKAPTLGEWLRSYIQGRSDIKAGTRVNYEQVEANLVAFFGASKSLEEVTPGHAEEFRVWLKSEKGLAEGTVRRRLKRAKQFFAAAVKRKVLTENPFAEIKCGQYANPERYYFVSREEAQAVLDACPDAEWRLIFALCRFGGLRCPSEVLRLLWEDIDWQRMRFTVHASKTEHHDGSGIRQVPIFPELYAHLRECFEQAEPGSEHVITRYRDTNQNLRTQLCRIIKRAGLAPWPKLFQNLRSTRETELTDKHPLHVVCAWIGNSQPIAAKHYLQVTEAHFAEAVQNPVQYVHASGRTESKDKSGEQDEPAFCEPIQRDAAHCENSEPHLVTPTGLEPVLRA